MEIRRLGWAGVEVSDSSGAGVVIDLLGDPSGVLKFAPDLLDGVPLPEVVEPRSQVLAGLCTHLHRDHADAAALADVLSPDAPVVHGEQFGGDEHENLWLLQVEAELAESGLARRVVGAWEELDVGPFRLSAVPAVDGIGDPQVSWVVSDGQRRAIHLGDTMFHGYWWRTAHRFGPIDVALVPINGPALCFPHCQPPSPLPGAMDPEQAALAGHLLGVGTVVPIHYGGFQIAGHYEPVPDDLARFLAAAQRHDYEVVVLEPGEHLSV